MLAMLLGPSRESESIILIPLLLLYHYQYVIVTLPAKEKRTIYNFLHFGDVLGVWSQLFNVVL